MIKRMAALLVTLSLFSFGTASGQPIDPGTAASAGVHDPDLRFSSALAWNPAPLARQSAHRFSLDLFGAAFNVYNNSVSTSFWNNHFAGDRFLSSANVSEILSQIPASGASIFGRFSAPLIGAQHGQYAGRISLESAGHGNLPKDLLELALRGNELGREYSLSEFRGESYFLVDYSGGFGHEFEQEWIPHLMAGAAFHFYQGLMLEKVADAGGSVKVTDSLIQGSALVQAVESSIGDGVGFDLGALAVWNDRLESALSLRQLGGAISWLVDKNHFASFAADSTGILIDSLENDNYLERAFVTEDTTYKGGTISTRLPSIILLNTKFRWSPKLSLLGEMQLATSGAPLGHPSFSTGIAAGYHPLRWLDLQSGVRVGGPERLQVGCGGSLNFKHYELQVGWEWNGGLFNSARGVGIGIMQRIKF